MVDCICDWPDSCEGVGTIFCEGCGGDQCVCACGGELSCTGCGQCPDDDPDDYDGDEDFDPDSEAKFQRENPRDDR